MKSLRLIMYRSLVNGSVKQNKSNFNIYVTGKGLGKDFCKKGLGFLAKIGLYFFIYLRFFVLF